MERKELWRWAIIGAIGLSVLVVVGVMAYLALTDYFTARYVFANHMRHYFVGLALAAVLYAVFWRKLSWQQEVVFLFTPVIIASGFPDIVYFVSYLLQHGTIIGVLTYKNAVYALMHNYLPALAAGPLLVALLLLYEKYVDPLPEKVWYWPIMLLAATCLASVLHILLDMRFGF